MRVHVVVEGKRDAELMQRLLEGRPRSVVTKFAIGAGKDAARPIARKIQRTKEEPLVFVADSDDPDAQRSAEQQRDYESYFRWSSGGVPFHVALMVPSIETLFFRDPGLVGRTLDCEVDKALQQVVTLAPKQALEVVCRDNGTNIDEFIRRVDASDIDKLREEPEIREIREFLAQFADASAKAQ